MNSFHFTGVEIKFYSPEWHFFEKIELPIELHVEISLLLRLTQYRMTIEGEPLYKKIFYLCDQYYELNPWIEENIRNTEKDPSPRGEE